MLNTFKTVIARGSYDLTAMLANIDRYHIEGKLTDAEREELYILARQEPRPQYDLAREIERLWEAVRALQEAPGGADGVLEFVQPDGAHNAYNTGDKVIYNGKTYICQMDVCVWSPDVLPAAWQLVEA